MIIDGRTIRRAATGVSLALLALLSVATAARAQTGRIVGTVTDSTAGYPVSSVRIILAGTAIGTVTRDDGTYSMLGVPPGTYTLETRRLGYAVVTHAGVVVTAGQTTTVDFRVESTVLRLQATVVTGVVDPTAGTKVPFTVGRVTKEDAPVPATNAVASIQGKIAGVMMVPPAQPGDAVSIQLRTPASINKSSAPLLVVDGVILSESTADLNSLDIESVEVVKGAAGASLYGSRAANGVIQIRTSRGAALASGQTQFTFRSEYGSSAIAHQLHWAQYHYYQTDATGHYVNAAGAVVPRTQRIARPAATRFQDVVYIDTLYDPVRLFFDPGKLITNSLTIAQNGDRTNFLTTLSRQQQDGVILGHGGYNRNDVRINLDHRPRADLSLSISAYNSRSDREELEGNTFFDLINQAPDLNLLQKDPDGTKYIFQPDPSGIRANPLYIAETDKNTTQRIRTLGSMDIRYTPLSWLTADANLSYDRSDQNGNEFVNRGVKIEAAPGISTGSLNITDSYTSSLNASASLSGLQQFGALTVRSTARVLVEQQKQASNTASGSNFAVAGVPRLDAALVKNSSSSEQEIKAEGFFLTGGVDYDGRIILDGLVRRDGSSLFGAGEKWHTYYRGSAAYRLAEERWWPWRRITEAKLRVSQGTAGTRPSFADQYETYTISGSGTLSKGTLGNSELRPETSKETEVGLDVIVDNKYSLQLSYADRTSTDQLLQIPLSGTLGYTSQWRNAGTVVGNSLEATFEAQVYRKGSTMWKVGFTADRSRNHISAFNSSCFRTGITYRCAGEDLTTMYGTAFVRSKDKLPASQSAALDQFEVNDDGLVVAVGPGGHYTDPGKWGTSVVSNGVTYAWGMPIILRDSTNQNAIVKIGNGNPDFHYGITNNVQWKGIQFFALLDSQVGGNAYNTTKQRMYQFQRSADVDQAGKPTERKKPIDYYVNVYNGATTTDWFVESGAYVKLREVSARYQLPRSLVSRIPWSRAVGASVSVVARNLYTWTSYSGYDPEVGTVNQRVDSYAYPQYRSITGVLQIQF